MEALVCIKMIEKIWKLIYKTRKHMREFYASCWVHRDCHVADVQKAALKKAAGVSGGKDECQVQLKGREHDYSMGFRAKKLPMTVQTNKAKWEQDIIT